MVLQRKSKVSLPAALHRNAPIRSGLADLPACSFFLYFLKDLRKPQGGGAVLPPRLFPRPTWHRMCEGARRGTSQHRYWESRLTSFSDAAVLLEDVLI